VDVEGYNLRKPFSWWYWRSLRSSRLIIVLGEVEISDGAGADDYILAIFYDVDSA
jgi:hypothetical protein